MIDTSGLIAITVFLLGMELCLWRFHRPDMWHVVLCMLAAILWTGILLLQPATRAPAFVGGTLWLLVFALSRPLRHNSG